MNESNEGRLKRGSKVGSFLGRSEPSHRAPTGLDEIISLAHKHTPGLV